MKKCTIIRIAACAAAVVLGAAGTAVAAEVAADEASVAVRGWAGCFEARLGRGDRAYRYLKDFQRAFVSRNGFHLNGDQLKCGLSRYTYRPFTLEGNFGYARGLQEMLLSYDPHTDTYKLFPALPKAWDGKEVSFRDLRLPGGHRVSAKRAADGTVTHTLVPNPRAKTIPRLAVSESGK